MLLDPTGHDVIPPEEEEEKELMDALDLAVSYVFSMGRPPPPPEEIESMLQTIESLEQKVDE